MTTPKTPVARPRACGQTPDHALPGVADDAASLGKTWPLPGSTLAGRALAQGLSSLDETELLEMLLELAGEADPWRAGGALLRRFGSLAAVLGASQLALARLVSPSVAEWLRLCHEIGVRVALAQVRQRDVLTSSSAVTAYLRVLLAAQPREQVWALFLDKRNQLILSEQISEGTVDHAPVYPREIVRRALELDASALILVHNHPSGDPNPSSADIDMTGQVVAAAKALKISVHDHMIVGRDQVASLRSMGLM